MQSPAAMRHGIFLVYQPASQESTDKKASFGPSLEKAILLPLEKVPTTFAQCIDYGAADSWWWKNQHLIESRHTWEGKGSCHATQNGMSSDSAFQSLTFFTEFLLKANHRRHVKMTKAGSRSTRSLLKSEDDTSWENAAWNIAGALEWDSKTHMGFSLI